MSPLGATKPVREMEHGTIQGICSAASVQRGKKKAWETFWLSSTTKLEDTEKTELDAS